MRKIIIMISFSLIASASSGFSPTDNLKKHILPKDLILIMGAGNIYQSIPEIVKELEKKI